MKLLQAAEQAYYGRDVEALRRVVASAEAQIAELQARLAESDAFGWNRQAATPRVQPATPNPPGEQKPCP